MRDARGVRTVGGRDRSHEHLDSSTELEAPMARRGPLSMAKRKREAAKRDKRQAKREKKAQRAEEKAQAREDGQAGAPIIERSNYES
jgi:hypothetical protein